MQKLYLETKFYIPPWREGSVSRPRLVEQLKSGVKAGHKLTLISAPAGYGKSTLAAEWIHSNGQGGVAWLSLDEGDNDPARFIGYLTTAFHRMDDSIGQSTQSLLGMTQLPPIQVIFDELINELAPLTYQALLVLDDYHIINNPDLYEAVEYFIEHLPSQIHLALTTREDPPLPLARLRGRKQLTEIREKDLRFTLDEARQFFSQSMPLDLEVETIQTLEARTEGWITGLQLAALALQNRPDQHTFLSEFTGSHRYIIDYLLDEVLKRQPPEIREFMSRTAILKRFNADLCQAVTGNTASDSILVQIERSNLFLTPLDEQRGWYRYHQLFSDVLRVTLSDKSQRDICVEAARWFESQNLFTEAISFWMESDNANEAARLIDGQADGLLKNGELHTLLGWLNALPESVVNGNLNLSSYKAFCLIVTSDLQKARDYIASAEQKIDGWEKSKGYGRFLSVQALIAMANGDTRAIEMTQSALEQLGTADQFFRAAMLFFLGIHHASSLNLGGAIAAYREALHLGRQMTYPFVILSALSELAYNLLDQGRLHEAENICRAALTKYIDSYGRPLPTLGVIYIRLASICYEKGAYDEASSFARVGHNLSQRLPTVDIGGELEIILARIAFKQGKVVEAFETLQAALMTARQRNWVQVVFKILLVQAELYLLQGNLAEAGLVLKELEALPQTILLHRERFLVYTRALYLVLSSKPKVALEILTDQEEASRAGGSNRYLLGIHITQALAYQNLSNLKQATRVFEQALSLAASEEYRSPFVPHSGHPTHPLLQATRHIAPEFVDSILKLSQPTRKPSDRAEGILSEQEMKVLKLIVGGKSNQEIADELVIGVGTAKWHVHNILQKLGADSRAQAMVRAQELGIR